MLSDLLQQARTREHQRVGSQGMVENVLALRNVIRVHREAFQSVLRVSSLHRVLRIVQPLAQCL